MNIDLDLDIHGDLELERAPRPSLRGSARTLTRGFAFASVFVTLVAFLGAPTPALAEEEGPASIDVVFVLDNSGSMKTNDPEFLTRRAVSDFMDALARSNDVDGRVGIVLFDDDARLVQRLTPASDLASTRTLSRTLGELDFSGQRTNSPAAIERALYELRERGRADARRAIVFLSDGRIDTGDPGRDYDVAAWLREDLASSSREDGILIFGIAFTEGADYQLMQELARRTDARYYRAFAPGELSTAVDDVLTRLSAPDAYALAAADLEADGVLPSTPPVAAAPLTDADAEDGGAGLLGWLPVLLLLAGGGFLLRDRLGGARVGAASAPAPPAQLLDLGGQAGEAGGAFALSPDRTSIGRDPHNDIVLESDTISSEHALIEYRDGRYWLQDLRSTNGTRRAGTKLEPDERVPLKGGDAVRFADVELMFAMKGYVPVGATAYLSSSTVPPGEWTGLAHTTDPGASPRRAVAAAPAVQSPSDTDVESASPPVDPADAPSGEVVFAEQRVRIDPASIVDLDEELGDATSGEASDPVLPSEDTFARVAIARAEEVLDDLDRQDGAAHLEPGPVAARPVTDASAAPPVVDPTPGPQPKGPVSPDPVLEEATEPTPPAFETTEVTLQIPFEELRAKDATPDPLDADDEITMPGEVPSSAEADDTMSPDVDPSAALRLGLDHHLERVGELSPAFGAFVEDAFKDEIREAMPIAANDLIEASAGSGRIEERRYTQARVRFLICGISGDMDAARDAFVASHGGFTRLLMEELQSESFRSERCRILAILTFGREPGPDVEPWVSLSVVPDEGEDPRIDLLSYEFLTPAERDEIEPNIDPEVSQSGLA